MAKQTEAVKAMTKHLRHRIRVAGIKASVRMGARNEIRVESPEYGVEFTEDEQRRIRLMARTNGLTHARGLPIDIEQMTNPFDFSFYTAA